MTLGKHPLNEVGEQGRCGHDSADCSQHHRDQRPAMTVVCHAWSLRFLSAPDLFARYLRAKRDAEMAMDGLDADKTEVRPDAKSDRSLRKRDWWVGLVPEAIDLYSAVRQRARIRQLKRFQGTGKSVEQPVLDHPACPSVAAISRYRRLCNHAVNTAIAGIHAGGGPS